VTWDDLKLSPNRLWGLGVVLHRGN